jgi:hypothetical protein
MRWLAQVRHVFAKDVRESWLAIGAYVLLVVVATAHALGMGTSISALGIVPLFVALLGVGTVAYLVQQDSPTSANAFWASHPIRPTAVLGAKVLSALLVLAIGAAGHALALRSYDLHGTELLRQVLVPVLAYAICLLLAMLLGALVRDMRSFLLAAILTPIAVLVAVGILPVPEETLDARAVVLGGAGVLAVLALLPWLYLTRDTRRVTRGIGFVAIALTMVLASAGMSSGPSSAMSASESSATGRRLRVPLQLERSGGQIISDDSQLELVLRRGAIPPGTRLIVEHPRLIVQLTDESTLRLPVGMGVISFDMMGTRMPPPMRGLRWLVAPQQASDRVTIGALLTFEQRRAVAGGVKSIALEGRAVVTEAETLTTLPLAAGSSVHMPGRRIAIDEWRSGPGAPTLAVRMTSIYGDPTDSWGGGSGVRFALVNAARGEGFPLGAANTSGAVEALVLPWTLLAASTMRFHMQAPGTGAQAPDAAWLRDARLILIKQHPVSSYPLHVELTAASPTDSSSPVAPVQSMPAPLLRP